MNRFFSLIFTIALCSTLGYSQSFLSIKEVLNIRKSINSETKTWINILKSKGYNKTMEYEGEGYVYKNCRLVYVDDKPYHSDGECFEADKKTINASYIHIFNGGFCVVVYTPVIARKWIEQTKALGYRLDKTRTYIDRFGSDFYFIKKGNPQIRITEKNGRYLLDIIL